MLGWPFPRCVRRRRRVVLGSTAPDAVTTSRPQKSSPKKTRKLPGEGFLYDRLDLTNLFDLGENKLTAAIRKTFRINVLSRLLDADLPARLVLGGRLGTMGGDGCKYDPVGKLSLSVRLLDLGGGRRERGWLKWQGSVKTNGRMNHGFEIERCGRIGSFRNSFLYGNVTYSTGNRLAKGVWQSKSSFGLDQRLKIWGLRLNARLGMTPEGRIVYDLRL